MSAPVRLTIAQLEQRLGVITERTPKALLVAMRGAVAFAIRYAVLNQLSGQKLRRITGTLQRDVEQSPKVKPPRIQGQSIIGTIGTTLGYGAAHEEGFYDIVAVHAHARRRLGKILARDIRTRAATKRKRISKAERARLGMSMIIPVRAHKRRMQIRARWYLRDSAKAANPGLNDGAMAAVEFLARTGRLPTLADIGAPGA